MTEEKKEAPKPGVELELERSDANVNYFDEKISKIDEKDNVKAKQLEMLVANRNIWIKKSQKLRRLIQGNPQDKSSSRRAILLEGEAIQLGESLCNVVKVKADGRIKLWSCGARFAVGDWERINGIYYIVLWSTETYTGLRPATDRDIENQKERVQK